MWQFNNQIQDNKEERSNQSGSSTAKYPTIGEKELINVAVQQAMTWQQWKMVSRVFQAANHPSSFSQSERHKHYSAIKHLEWLPNFGPPSRTHRNIARDRLIPNKAFKISISARSLITRDISCNLLVHWCFEPSQPRVNLEDSYQSWQPWCNPLWLTGLKARTN